MAALLAKKTGRPVRLFLSREQVCLSMGNRPGNTITLKAGVKKDGTLVALQSKTVGSGGAYSDGGTGGVDFVIRELYACPNVRCENQSVYINAGPERPFRAPGHPQGAWALEIMLDALAAKIGMDPIALRLKNITLISQTRNGNPPYTSTGFSDCLKNGAEAFGWAQARARTPAPSHIKRGVGVAGGIWQGGGGSPPSTAIVKLFADGSANLNMGASDIGTGTKTWGVQIVAEELGVPMDRISVEHADTGTTQFATPSGGSKTVPTESPAIRSAALDVKQQLFAMAAEQLKLPAADLELRGAEVVSKTDATKKVGLGQIQAFGRRGLLVGIGYRVPNPPGKVTNPFGVQFAEVEVNTKTGEIKVVRFLAAHDSGRIMNAKMFQNQVSGGVTMGIGFGLTEDRVMDRAQLGKLLTVNLHDYKMPTALDAPADKTVLVVDPRDNAFSNTGAKGVGEPATIPTAPAIANAVFHATGLRLTDAPMSPARVLNAIARPEAGPGGSEGEGVMLRTFAYVRPASVSEALKQMEDRGARLHAGGTDLIGCLRDGVFEAGKVVSLGKLDELRGITVAPDGELRIGALTTIAEIAAHPVVAGKFAALAQAASVVASPQLRNQGTIGGNLCQRPRCWYFRGDYHCTRKGGDMCYALGGENQYHCIFGGGACVIVHPSDTAPALIALDAKVRIIGPKGARVIPLEQFYVLPEKDATRETVLEPGEMVLGRARAGHGARAEERVPQGPRARVVGLRDGRTCARVDVEGGEDRRRTPRAVRRGSGAVAAAGRREAPHRAETRSEAHRSRRGRGDCRGEAPGAQRLQGAARARPHRGSARWDSRGVVSQSFWLPPSRRQPVTLKIWRAGLEPGRASPSPPAAPAASTTPTAGPSPASSPSTCRASKRPRR